MAEFISFVEVAGGSVTVAEGCDLVVIAVSRSDSTGTGATATLGGTALDVASNDNPYTQIYYRLNPSTGAQALTIDPDANISAVYAAQYSGISEFSGAAQSSAASQSLTLSRGGVLAFVMSAVSTSHTPLAGTTEPTGADSGGDYFGYRIVGSSGTFSVGVASATDPDSTAAAWLDEESGNDLTAAAAFTAGGANMTAEASRGRSVSSAGFAAGAATAATSAVRGHPVSAAGFAAGTATMATAATVARSVGNAAFAAGSATMAATVTVSGNREVTTAAFSAGAAAVVASASRGRLAVAAFAASAPLFSASAEIQLGTPGICEISDTRADSVSLFIQPAASCWLSDACGGDSVLLDSAAGSAVLEHERAAFATTEAH